MPTKPHSDLICPFCTSEDIEEVSYLINKVAQLTETKYYCNTCSKTFIVKYPDYELGNTNAKT